MTASTWASRHSSAGLTYRASSSFSASLIQCHWRYNVIGVRVAINGTAFNVEGFGVPNVSLC
jgi:hypothetical protein